MEKVNDLISVIIPIYNVEKYLKKCIDSICEQTYTNMEILLVDDGSTDDCPQICDEAAQHDSRVRVIHQKNGGRSVARNRGIEESTGKYIMFVDGDDWIDADCLQKSYEALVEYQAQMVVFRGRNIYVNTVEDESTEEKLLLTGAQPLEFYVNGKDGFQNSNTVWGKLYVSELLKDIRFVENKYYEDLMFITKAYATCTRCIYLNQAYYNYNIATDTSITFLGVNELTFRDEIPIFEEKEELLRGLGREDLAQRYAYFKYQRLLTYYRECMDAGEKGYAKRLAMLIRKDKRKIKCLIKKEYASKYYRLYFKIFLFCPSLSYLYETLTSKLFARKG